VLVVALGALLLARSAALAGVDPAALCSDKKGIAVGVGTLQTLVAFGKNLKKQNVPKLATGLSKARSKLSKSFTKAEFTGKGDPRGCQTTGDAAAMQNRIDVVALDVIDDLDEATPVTSTTTPTTSTTAPATSTTTTPMGSTTTTTISPLCGNGTINPGETCDDGGNSNNDACPANCVLEACTPIVGTERQVDVFFSTPANLGGIIVLLDYPEGRVEIPGGPPPGGPAIPAGTIINPPPGTSLIPLDWNHALRVTAFRQGAIAEGRLFTVKFRDCAGAPTPPISDGQFPCTVLQATDPLSNPVGGVTCSVEGATP
jgi:cysteine-rich repeat protein